MHVQSLDQPSGTAPIPSYGLKVGDAVWIGAALLQREHPSREATGFSVEEIVDKVLSENLTEGQRISVYLHANQHCVANRRPNPGRLRMLFELPNGNRRLFREGDAYDPAREGARTAPEAGVIPHAYADLLPWYHGWQEQNSSRPRRFQGLIDSIGSGKDVWTDESGDDYVRRLRKDWE